MTNTPPMPPEVAKAFERVALPHQNILFGTRAAIFAVAADDPRIGPVDEALRWGEPAYLTAQTKTGSTIRLGIEKASGMPALFFNCNTGLVERFRQQFADTLRYSKNRAVLLDFDDATHATAINICIQAALTYHIRKS